LLLRLLGYMVAALAVMGVAQALFDEPKCEGCDFIAGGAGLLGIVALGALVVAFEIGLHERRRTRAALQDPAPGRSDWDD